MRLPARISRGFPAGLCKHAYGFPAKNGRGVTIARGTENFKVGIFASEAVRPWSHLLAIHSPQIDEPGVVTAIFYVLTHDLFLHGQRRGANYCPEP